MRFDSSQADQFLVAVRAGASNDTAAAHAGVPLDVVRAWLRGDTEEEAAFRRDVEKARADLELLAVGTVRRGVVDDTGSAKWVAEYVAGQREFERLRELTT
jgi:hypothetical protein